MRRNLSAKILLIGIIILGAFLRLYGLNWDQGHHLHPDERFLTMVGIAMIVPNSLMVYLDPAVSTFNPANVGSSFFVYGTFPLIITKLLAVLFRSDNYDAFVLFGRSLSALVDVFVILLVFKTVELFEKHNNLNRSIKFWSAGFYAISVLPIQLSHFFTVDPFLNLFVFASIYTALKYSFEKKIIYLITCAVFFGLAIASKISAIFVSPLLLFLIIHLKTKHFKKTFFSLILFGLICFIILRFANPYMFESSNMFDPRPNSLFIQNIESLKNLSDPNGWFPPNLQWRNTMPVIFPLKNIMFFGLGIPLFILVVIGSIYVAYKYHKTKLFVFLLWSLIFFVYQAIQSNKTMRYFLILYPFFAIFAGVGLVEITKILKHKVRNKLIFHTSYFILIALLPIWTLAFMSIYTKDHARVEASNYVYQNFPDGSIILSEHWDDAVPLLLPNIKTFDIRQLPVFGEDNSQKWNEMNGLLEQGEYLTLSSNRGWGSIPKSSDRYPLTTVYYMDLFSDKLEYKKIATFTSYPSLKYLGIPITFGDDDAEEAFTVYDHPKVIIFKKM